MTEASISNPEVAEYVQKHKIEKVITDSVNEVLSQLPPDPFSGLLEIIKTKSKAIFTVNSLSLDKELQKNFTEIPVLTITMTYQGSTRKIMRYPLPINNQDLNEYLKTKNYEDLYTIFYEKFANNLAEQSIYSVDKFDHLLMKISSVKDKNEEQEEEKQEEVVEDPKAKKDPKAAAKAPAKGKDKDQKEFKLDKKDLCKNICNAISFSTFVAMSSMCNKSMKQHISDSYPDLIINENHIPHLGFSLFKTGKTMGSKVKFERFLIFINNNDKLEKDVLFNIIDKLYQSIKKVLTSGKAGEAGMRLNNEGSFFPPSDALNDILKLLETAISENDYKDKLYIGIDCNANNYYTEESKTYEMDGFKKPLNMDELLDFYLKLIADHPLIMYLEQPAAAADEEGMEKLVDKFTEEKPNVHICEHYVKKISPENLNKTRGMLLSESSVGSMGSKGKKGDLRTEPNPEVKSKNFEENPTEHDIPKTEENKEEQGDEYSESYNKSYRISEMDNITELLDNVSLLKESESLTWNIYDQPVESNQSVIVDLGIGMRCNSIILNGLTMNEDKTSKIIRYIETVSDLY